MRDELGIYRGYSFSCHRWVIGNYVEGLACKTAPNLGVSIIPQGKEPIEVYKGSVGQCSSFTDINDKPVFEGMPVKCHKMTSDIKGLVSVKTGCFCVTESDTGRSYLLSEALNIEILPGAWSEYSAIK